MTTTTDDTWGKERVAELRRRYGKEPRRPARTVAGPPHRAPQASPAAPPAGTATAEAFMDAFHAKAAQVEAEHPERVPAAQVHQVQHEGHRHQREPDAEQLVGQVEGPAVGQGRVEDGGLLAERGLGGLVDELDDRVDRRLPQGEAEDDRDLPPHRARRGGGQRGGGSDGRGAGRARGGGHALQYPPAPSPRARFRT